MTSIFDGMAEALNDVFGASVMYRQRHATVSTEIEAVFREEPVEVLVKDGRRNIITDPTLKVPKSIDPGIRADDVITPGNGKTYQVIHRVPDGSPAVDAFNLFALEEAVQP